MFGQHVVVPIAGLHFNERIHVPMRSTKRIAVLSLALAVVAAAACSETIAPAKPKVNLKQPTGVAATYNWYDATDVGNPSYTVYEVANDTPCPDSGSFKIYQGLSDIKIKPLWTSCRQFSTSERQYIENDVFPAIFGISGCEDLALELYEMVFSVPPRMQVGLNTPHYPDPNQNIYFRGTTHTPTEAGPFGGITLPISIISNEFAMSGFPGDGTRTLVHEAFHSWAWRNRAIGPSNTEANAMFVESACWS